MATTSGSVGELASRRRRIGALVIDFILTSIVSFILLLLITFIFLEMIRSFVAENGNLYYFGMQFYLLTGQVGYYVIMEGLFSTTIGKKGAGIRVVDESGGQIGMGKSVIRNVLRFIDVLPVVIGWYVIGFLFMFVSDDEQRLGDMVANTYVVRE